MYEHHHRPLLPRAKFVVRLWKTITLATVLTILSLGIGMCGYHYFESMPWIDAFVSAAMILSGMGPVSELHTEGGKLFAGCYALYSGLALITIVGLVVAPILHRFLHKFHLENEEK